MASFNTPVNITDDSTMDDANALILLGTASLSAAPASPKTRTTSQPKSTPILSASPVAVSAASPKVTRGAKKEDMESDSPGHAAKTKSPARRKNAATGNGTPSKRKANNKSDVTSSPTQPQVLLELPQEIILSQQQQQQPQQSNNSAATAPSFTPPVNPAVAPTTAPAASAAGPSTLPSVNGSATNTTNGHDTSSAPAVVSNIATSTNGRARQTPMQKLGKAINNRKLYPMNMEWFNGGSVITNTGNMPIPTPLKDGIIGNETHIGEENFDIKSYYKKWKNDAEIYGDVLVRTKKVHIYLTPKSHKTFQELSPAFIKIHLLQRNKETGDWAEFLSGGKPVFNYSFTSDMTEERWSIEIRWPEKGPYVGGDYVYCFQVDIFHNMRKIPIATDAAASFEFQRETKRSSQFRIAAKPKKKRGTGASQDDSQEYEDDEEEFDSPGPEPIGKSPLSPLSPTQLPPPVVPAAAPINLNNNNNIVAPAPLPPQMQQPLAPLPQQQQPQQQLQPLPNIQMLLRQQQLQQPQQQPQPQQPHLMAIDSGDQNPAPPPKKRNRLDSSEVEAGVIIGVSPPSSQETEYSPSQLSQSLSQPLSQPSSPQQLSQ